MEFVNGKDDIPYMMENKSYVWKQQPYIYIYTYLIHIYTFTYILRIRTLPAKGWEGTDTAPWIIPQYFLRRYVHPKEYIYIYIHVSIHIPNNENWIPWFVHSILSGTRKYLPSVATKTLREAPLRGKVVLANPSNAGLYWPSTQVVMIYQYVYIYIYIFICKYILVLVCILCMIVEWFIPKHTYNIYILYIHSGVYVMYM